ncbi:MAG: cytochrome oxidase subunit III [Saprospiraceae bacterium]|nr:cytochrome oxidase subunit III [Saprospiraceae bacterium]
MSAETMEGHAVMEEQSGKLWSGGKSPFKSSYGKLMMWYFLLSDAFTFAGFLIAYGTLRFSNATWPVPDFVFSSFPFLKGTHYPLLFVSLMTFILLASSFTMIRAVQEGKEENKSGIVKWMIYTIIGGLMFLGCQAWEWNTLISTEHMTISTNPFGTHLESGVYLDDEHGHAYAAAAERETFDAGDSYLIHRADEQWLKRRFELTSGPNTGQVSQQEFGPKAFGALFFCITGFHGFHVFSGVVFLILIAVNVANGLYAKRRNGYEMVEKIGLYWHFVDLVWVFVFLVFYLL